MSLRELSNRFENHLHILSSRYAMVLMRISIGVIYLWFGTLKFFPGLSPAEELAGDTLSVLVLHSIDQQVLLWTLALVEVMIGVFLLAKVKSNWLIYAVLTHMTGTLLPLFIFSDVVFHKPPFGFSIVGQYIMKNFVIISAILLIYSKQYKQ